MKNTFLIITLLFSVSAVGQILNAEFIDNYIRQCDPQLNLNEKHKIYILDGILYDSKTLNEVLNTSIVNRAYFTIDYFDPGKQEKQLIYCLKPNVLFITISSGNQKLKTKDKKRLLADYKLKFVDDHNLQSTHIPSYSKNPVLIVDGVQINYFQAAKYLNKIDRRQIKHLTYMSHSPATIYGQHAQNGLLKIWTKTP